MDTEQISQLIALIGPVVAKSVTDWVRKLLPSLQFWQIRLGAVAISYGATWLAGYLTGHQLSAAMTGMLSLLVFVVNGASNTVRDYNSDKGATSNPSSDKPVV